MKSRPIYTNRNSLIIGSTPAIHRTRRRRQIRRSKIGRFLVRGPTKSLRRGGAPIASMLTTSREASVLFIKALVDSVLFIGAAAPCDRGWGSPRHFAR